MKADGSIHNENSITIFADAVGQKEKEEIAFFFKGSASEQTLSDGRLWASSWESDSLSQEREEEERGAGCANWLQGECERARERKMDQYLTAQTASISGGCGKRRELIRIYHVYAVLIILITIVALGVDEFSFLSLLLFKAYHITRVQVEQKLVHTRLSYFHHQNFYIRIGI